MGFCQRCGEVVYGTNCLKCGGRSISSATSGLQSNSRTDPWASAYQGILEGGFSKPTKRMSMPAASPALSPVSKMQPLVMHKHCHGCSKQIHQARVFAEPGKPNFIYCEKCYVEKFTKGNCPSCLKPVLSKTDPYITHSRRTWHAACFRCFMCSMDLASKPMVDLQGRPCCEGCLMSQAGTAAEERPPSIHQEKDIYKNTSALSSDMTLANSTGYPSSFASTSPERFSRPQLNLSSLDINMEKTLQHQSSPPLSAQSSSSHSSLGTSSSRNNAPSSGYTSGTSSTYSSLGRKCSSSTVPSVLPTSSPTGNILRVDHPGSPAISSPHLSFRRPSSALSIHSYTSSGSRPDSPLSTNLHDQDSGDTFKLSDYPEGLERDQDQKTIENSSESTIYGLRHPSSRSSVGLYDLGSSLSDVLSRPESKPGYERSSRPSTPADAISAHNDGLKSLASVETDLVARVAGVSLSSPIQIRPSVDQQSKPAMRESEPTRRPMGRTRSRSTVVPPSSASVKARKEAYMNQAQSTSPPTPRTSSQFFNLNRSSVNLSTPAVAKPEKTRVDVSPMADRDTKVSKPESIEKESDPPQRPSFRHGRQRSNTVGEAISFPVVSVEKSPSNSSHQRSGALPDGHCHKCHEKVTENGVRLQNGDRYHIGCFLCHGCKQVFTESEFHVVMGRPYHPSCVSMAGATSTMGVSTKCNQCQRVIGSKSIRFAGANYHPQCFTCGHCSKVLTSTSRFYEVDGRVECEKCCDERDAVRLAPKVVPVPRSTDNFPMAPSGPGMMATAGQGNISRSGSGNAFSSLHNGEHSPAVGSPGSAWNEQSSPGAEARDSKHNSGSSSPVLVMPSPLAQRATPPTLSSFFGTRTRPLPKFGGVTNCPRCHQAVGVMDQVPGPKNEKWHKKCLTCKSCSKALDSSALTRGEGEAYCRGCFNKTRVRT